MESESASVGVYEAARYLRCSSQWIRILLGERRLPGARKGGWGLDHPEVYAGTNQAAPRSKAHRITVKDGRWVDAQTGAPIQ